MLTQQTTDDLSIVGYFATEFEYAPYLVLAALLLWALFLTLRTRNPAPSRKTLGVDEPEKIETDEQLAAPASPVARKRYVDADARTILAPREATLSAVAVAAADELVAARQTTHQVRKAADRPDPFYDSLGFGVFILTASFAAMAFLLGWEFPGVEAVFNFTTAGWWIVGILFALTIPAIVRISRQQDGSDRLFTAAAGLAGSAALTAAAATPALVRELDRAGPFGAGAPEPVLALASHTVASADVVGQGHVRLRLRSGDGSSVGAIAFRAAESDLGRALIERRGGRVHAAGVLSIDRWGGSEKASLRLIDAAPADD